MSLGRESARASGRSSSRSSFQAAKEFICLHPPAQQSLTNAKPSQSHLNELHHLPGLCDGDCQLLQLVLRITEEFGFLGLWTRRTNAELCSPSPGGREAQGTLPISKLSPQPLSDHGLATRLRVKGARA